MFCPLFISFCSFDLKSRKIFSGCASYANCTAKQQSQTCAAERACTGLRVAFYCRFTAVGWSRIIGIGDSPIVAAKMFYRRGVTFRSVDLYDGVFAAFVHAFPSVFPVLIGHFTCFDGNRFADRVAVFDQLNKNFAWTDALIVAHPFFANDDVDLVVLFLFVIVAWG